MSGAGMHFGSRYRTVEEPALVEMLRLVGFAFEEDHARASAHARLALDRWVDSGLGVRIDADGGRRFDPVEVFVFLKQCGLAHADRFWSDHYVETARRMVLELPSLPDQTFHVEFRREFNLLAVPPGTAVRIRAPLPLASVHGRVLELEPYLLGAAAANLRVSDGRLEARCVANGDAEVVLGAVFRLGFAASVGPEDREPKDYLKLLDGIVGVSAKVCEVAEQLAGARHSDWDAVRAFWDFMMDRLACGPVHYDQIGATPPCDWVLKTGWYDCQLGSALFVALCRARGIPARLVGGHFLYAKAPTNHYWAEVYLDQEWLPFDVWSWDLSRGGHDKQWRRHFFGRADSRLVTQRFPYEFTGALGVMLPEAWHMLQRPHGRGVSVCIDALDRRSVYRDIISVEV